MFRPATSVNGTSMTVRSIRSTVVSIGGTAPAARFKLWGVRDSAYSPLDLLP
jgi:hypothetical protein